MGGNLTVVRHRACGQVTAGQGKSFRVSLRTPGIINRWVYFRFYVGLGLSAIIE